MALATGIAYGGVTEEVMMRWGLLSALACLALRRAAPSVAFPVAIAVSALVFAALHLPAALAFAAPEAPVLARTLLLNGLGGLAFGWLYWRHTLESAMIAHATVHVVFCLARLAA
ncbi:MAG TPA: CPBP family glutamic-type intramembrane protease [Burkholderiales bacterium]|nr:CPBP family glutamic-type intramembrane protease [Burkholderiales bacterium]